MWLNKTNHGPWFPQPKQWNNKHYKEVIIWQTGSLEKLHQLLLLYLQHSPWQWTTEWTKQIRIFLLAIKSFCQHGTNTALVKPAQIYPNPQGTSPPKQADPNTKKLIFLADGVKAGITCVGDICYEAGPSLLPTFAIHEILTNREGQAACTLQNLRTQTAFRRHLLQLDTANMQLRRLHPTKPLQDIQSCQTALLQAPTQPNP